MDDTEVSQEAVAASCCPGGRLSIGLEAHTGGAAVSSVPMGGNIRVVDFCALELVFLNPLPLFRDTS